MISSLALVPRGCSIRTMVKFASDVVAKQRGPVKRCANHKSEDMQAGMVYCIYCIPYVHYDVL